ncbi:RNA-binding protein, putative [Trypanosoma equiperdum]|uniref:RNA-binding protein, putative n=2 Tax=Trypanozoon TaxID=39700 RepID=Q387J8_TRYB2|nr:uncharacterized protein Tb11.03.0550 [Trypanosoma brucei brucei TREU927]EAN79033.1 RNA-binding protein, putative [Trypanosoma brucei brucei TREU927]SCU64881.1 RNA-binding protein, putative [Trypanosoma equiperdum]
MEPECESFPVGEAAPASTSSPFISTQMPPPMTSAPQLPSNEAEAPEGSKQHLSGGLTPRAAPFAAPRPSFSMEPEPLRNLIVNYLPPMMDEDRLFQLFAQFGPIESVKIIYDKVTRESRGYGFVKYMYFFSATYAVQWLNGYPIAGKRLKVAFANAEAAMESYKAMSASAMMFTMQQQAAMQNIFQRQMFLAQQQQQQQN